MRSMSLFWGKYQMNQRNPQLELAERSWPSRRSGAKRDLTECDRPTTIFKNPFSSRCAGNRRSQNVFSSDWANSVPSLIEKLVSEVVEKKKMELRFSLLEIAVSALKSRIDTIDAAKTRIVPINTFAPGKYD